MKKTLVALATGAALAAATLAPSPADAGCRGCGVAAGAVIGGVAAGAVIAGAVGAPPPYAYPPAYYTGYEPYPPPEPARSYSCPDGYWARRPIPDAFGNVIGYTRPRFFCPGY